MVCPGFVFTAIQRALTDLNLALLRPCNRACFLLVGLYRLLVAESCLAKPKQFDGSLRCGVLILDRHIFRLPQAGDDIVLPYAGRPVSPEYFRTFVFEYKTLIIYLGVLDRTPGASVVKFLSSGMADRYAVVDLSLVQSSLTTDRL